MPLLFFFIPLVLFFDQSFLRHRFASLPDVTGVPETSKQIEPFEEMTSFIEYSALRSVAALLTNQCVPISHRFLSISSRQFVAKRFLSEKSAAVKPVTHSKCDECASVEEVKAALQEDLVSGVWGLGPNSQFQDLPKAPIAGILGPDPAYNRVVGYQRFTSKKPFYPQYGGVLVCARVPLLPLFLSLLRVPPDSLLHFIFLPLLLLNRRMFSAGIHDRL